MREFTESQKAALTGKGKLVLAGAGSGKTTVLTEKYVALLATSDLRPRDIVAMTFSRKAAANLQAKIHAALLERQKTDTENADHWRAQREQMPWARIGTIHSICAGLLRAFPLEAEVDPEFTLSERADDRDEALQQRLRRLAWQRDGDYAALLELLGGRKKVERAARCLMDRPDVVTAIRKAQRNRDVAVDYLDAAYTQGYRELNQEAGTPSTGTHQHYVEALELLLRVVEPLLRAEGEAAAQLTFDDVEFHALRLMEKDRSAARRIRESIRFLLVDEFQDTSTRQWRLIRLLTAGKSGEPDLDRLFLVGDDKQSIYGFRSANVTVVESARREFERSQKPEKDWFVRLDDNFRTLPELLIPLNETFDRLLPKERKEALPFEALSGALIPRRTTPKNVIPVAELLLGVGASPETVFAELAERLKNNLGTMTIVDAEMGDGNSVRPLRPEDVGILLRTRTRQPLLEKALRDAGVLFRVTGGRGFMEQQEVLDLVHLLTALSDPRDQLALVGVLRSPLFSLSDAAVAAIMLADGDPYHGWKSLAMGQDTSGDLLKELDDDDRAALRRSWAWWSRWSELVEHRGPTETLMEALEAGGAWAAYAVGNRGEQRIANIYRFLDFVRGFSEEGHYTLRRLVERIRQEKESPGEESEKEAELIAEGGVAVMTIHAAKGLEFPYVILPDLVTAPRKRGISNLTRGHLLLSEGPFFPLADPGLAVVAEAVAGEDGETLHAAMYRDFAPAEEAAERLRLMYVAATRARDHLLMVSHVKVGYNKTRGRFLDLPPDSHLAEWMKALRLELSVDGIAGGPELPGVAVHLFGDEKKKRDVADHVKSVKEKLPEVRINPLPRPDRWTLPFTSFTSWLVNPSEEETLRLIWFTGDVQEIEAIGEEEIVSVGRDEALLIGDFVHRMYQLHGPGCSWVDVQDDMDRELRAWSMGAEAGGTVRARLKQLFGGGGAMKLQEIPGDARRELPITLRIGPVVLRGKADLAWRDGNTAHVLDYKTNRMNGSAGASTVAEEHGYDHQVRLYGLALMKAWGAREAVCKVAFLDSGEGVEYRVALEDERGYAAHAETLVARWREVSQKGRSILWETSG
ncbi:MAG: UvrD-helicase domain-containing protein [bacterium]